MHRKHQYMDLNLEFGKTLQRKKQAHSQKSGRGGPNVPQIWGKIIVGHPNFWRKNPFHRPCHLKGPTYGPARDDSTQKKVGCIKIFVSPGLFCCTCQYHLWTCFFKEWPLTYIRGMSDLGTTLAWSLPIEALPNLYRYLATILYKQIVIVTPIPFYSKILTRKIKKSQISDITAEKDIFICRPY